MNENTQTYTVHVHQKSNKKFKILSFDFFLLYLSYLKLMIKWCAEFFFNFRHNFEAAPVFITIENFVIAELNKLIGFEQGDGIFVPGCYEQTDDFIQAIKYISKAWCHL